MLPPPPLLLARLSSSVPLTRLTVGQVLLLRRGVEHDSHTDFLM